MLSFSPLESGKQWNSFIRGEKEEKTVDRKNNGDIRFNGTKHDDAEQNGIKDENTQICRQGDVLRKEC